MKIWLGYGSEHSANLVMIGKFNTAADAAKAMQVIERLRQQVDADIAAGAIKVGERRDRFSGPMLDLLGKVNLMTVSAGELEQFAYDIDVKITDTQIVVTTDEVDVSAFLKVLIDKGAHIEVYSAHDYPGTGYGRGV